MKTLPLVALAFALACSSRPAPPPVLGEKLPPFEALSLQGEKQRFPEGFLDKVVLIRFWTERCPHCEAEMRGLEEIYQRYEKEGFAFLAVNVGQTRDSVAAFAQKLGLSYPILLDENGSLGKRFGVKGVPASFLMDKNGTLRAHFMGQTQTSTFEHSIRALLSLPPLPTPPSPPLPNAL